MFSGDTAFLLLARSIDITGFWVKRKVPTTCLVLALIETNADWNAQRRDSDEDTDSTIDRESARFRIFPDITVHQIPRGFLKIMKHIPRSGIRYIDKGKLQCCQLGIMGFAYSF